MSSNSQTPKGTISNVPPKAEPQNHMTPTSKLPPPPPKNK